MPVSTAPPGDIVVDALLGVVPFEKSVEGEIVSADEGPSASAEYGGGGDDIGSTIKNEQAKSDTISHTHTIWSPQPRSVRNSS